MRRNLVTLFSLFSSASTLVCCALPALIVTVAGGAALAGLVSSFPQLVWISEHKTLIFIIGGLLLALAIYTERKNRTTSCPVDPAAAKACLRLRRFEQITLVISILMYAIGAFFAFAAPYIF